MRGRVGSSGPFPSTPEGAPSPSLRERSGAPSGVRPSSFVMSDTPIEVQFTSAGCLNYPCRTPLREGDIFRNAAFHGPLPAAYVEQWRSATVRPAPDVPLALVAQSGKPVQLPDLRESRGYRDRHPLTVTAVDVGGIRTLVAVPMHKEDEFVGTIAIY